MSWLVADTTKNTEEGLLEVYRKLRPGEPPTVEISRSHLDALCLLYTSGGPAGYFPLRGRAAAGEHHQPAADAGR